MCNRTEAGSWVLRPVDWTRCVTTVRGNDIGTEGIKEEAAPRMIGGGNSEGTASGGDGLGLEDRFAVLLRG
jgi:hypothetical protein